MIRSARVLSDAEAATKAWVEVQGVSACQRCARGQGCGAGIFNHGVSASRLTCFTSEPVLANQTVDIEIQEAGSNWLWLVAGAYGLPLLGLFLGSLSANWVMTHLSASLPFAVSVSNDAAVAIAAIVGLAGGLIAWRMLSKTVLARLEKGLCLNSARIVNNSASAVPLILERLDEN